MKKNLVTGGAGFLGSNIVNELLNLGEEVVVFDNGFRQDFTNIEGIKGKFSLIKGDITIKEDWEKLPKDFDVVTEATPEQIRKVIPRSRIKGRRFKLIHARKGRKITHIWKL